MIRTGNRFIIFSGLILLLILVLENINGRFWLSDFKVYYGAARAFVDGDRVYGVVFGEDTGLYKYSPFLLFLFAPATLLPFKMAAVIHFLLTSLSAILLFLLLYRMVSKYFQLSAKNASLWMSLGFLVILNHLFRELHLGNVNIILVLFLIAALYQCVDGKQISAGILTALSLSFKPYFIILILPLLFFRKWKTIFSIILTSVAMLLFCVMLMGFQDAVWMHIEWFNSMRYHNEVLDSYNNLPALIKIYTSLTPGYWSALFLLGSVIFLLWLLVKKDTAKASVDGVFILSYCVLLALIPNLVITDTEHFLFATPLIIFLLLIVPTFKNWLAVALMILIFLMYGANSPEFFGHELADRIDHSGVLGIANMLLIGISIWTFNTLQARKGIGIL